LRFLVATLAHLEGRAVAIVDFPGAYLNADMLKSGNVVRMRLDRECFIIVIQLGPSLEQYLCEDDTIKFELDKALYGLVEAAKLWYDLLTSKLESVGYKRDPYDQCVFNRVVNDGSQSTLCVHADDMMITAASEEHVTNVIADIENEFREITVTRGTKHDYLGMVFDFCNSNKLIVNDILIDCNVTGSANSSAKNDLFHINESADK